MAQTELAPAGAVASEGPPRIAWFGSGGRRWTGAVVVATIVLALGGGLAWFAWHSTQRTTPHVAGSTAIALTGDVAVEGGAPESSGSDINPIRSAPMLVTGITNSGRRVTRRFTADRHGHFKLVLPPGRYTVTAVLYQGAIPLAREPHATVRVRAGQQPNIHILQHAA
jgi:hypothetical protein